MRDPVDPEGKSDFNAMWKNPLVIGLNDHDTVCNVYIYDKSW